MTPITTRVEIGRNASRTRAPKALTDDWMGLPGVGSVLGLSRQASKTEANGWLIS